MTRPIVCNLHVPLSAGMPLPTPVPSLLSCGESLYALPHLFSRFHDSISSPPWLPRLPSGAHCAAFSHAQSPISCNRDYSPCPLGATQMKNSSNLSRVSSTRAPSSGSNVSGPSRRDSPSIRHSPLGAAMLPWFLVRQGLWPGSSAHETFHR